MQAASKEVVVFGAAAPKATVTIKPAVLGRGSLGTDMSSIIVVGIDIDFLVVLPFKIDIELAT